MKPRPTLRSAAVWSLIDRVARLLLQFVIGIILARLLTPADYGLVGMLAIFIAVGNVLASGGLGLALIQRKDLVQGDETTSFYMNVGLGLLLTAALYSMGPAIANFYGQPILQELVQLSSFQVLITSLGVVQGALLTRAMDFKTQAVVSLVVTVVSGTVGIAMALNGAGVWSLVVQGLVACALNSLLLWLVSPWRPRGQPQWVRLRSLAGFSANSLGSGLLFVGFDSLYPIVIGKLYSPASLGLYTRANQLQQLPGMIVTDVVGRVAFPHFSSLQGDRHRLNADLSRLSRLIGSVHFPVMVGMAAVADRMIPLLLTDKWRDCVPLLQILCLAGLLYPINALHVSAINAQGRADAVLRLELVKKVALVALLLATFRFGIVPMVWGLVVHSAFCAVLNLSWNRLHLGYSIPAFILDHTPYLLLSIASGSAALLVGRFIAGTSVASLSLQVLAGVTVYAVGVFVLRSTYYRDIWAAFRFVLARGTGSAPGSGR